MSITNINLSNVYDIDSLRREVDDVLESLSAKQTATDSYDTVHNYNVNFIYNKKLGCHQVRQTLYTDNHVRYELRTKENTLYNYLFNPETVSLATPLFAILYFGTVIGPLADWLQGQLQENQLGEIRAHYCDNSDHIETDLLIDRIVRNTIRGLTNALSW
jgi:hypothetical protein